MTAVRADRDSFAAPAASSSPDPTGSPEQSDRAELAVVEFCGERHELRAGVPFIIGRDADLVVDDNPYLHRRFLVIEFGAGMWWLQNLGTQLAATVSDSDGAMQAWLSPGARIPLVFTRTRVWFTAGPTTYELEIELSSGLFEPAIDVDTECGDGTTTIGSVPLTPEQLELLLVLAEPVLRRGSGSEIPSSADAAARLGWTVTKFNRKLDAICEKLSGQGVRGLYGSQVKLASNRRVRLVEYAVSSRIVTAERLALLQVRETVVASD